MPRGKLTKPRAARVTRDLVRAAGRRAAQGQKAPEIAKALNVALRTAYKLVERARAAGDLDSYAPWTLLSAMEHGDPVDKARWLIAADTGFERGFDATRREGEWAWLLHNIRTDLSMGFIFTLAERYLIAEHTPAMKWTARALDWALRSSPWESQENALHFYSQAVVYAPAREDSGRTTDLAILGEIEIGLRRYWRLETKADGALAPSITVNPDSLDPEARAEIVALMNLRLQDDAQPIRGWVGPPLWPLSMRMAAKRAAGVPLESQVASEISKVNKLLRPRAKGGKS